METNNKSLFNLIEVFSKGKMKVVEQSDSSTHCEKHQLHDFYCNAEKPFVAITN